jgi:protein disulfide-isomerase
MKNLLFIVLLVFSFSAKAQALKWETDVAKACETSIKSKKPILLFFTGSDWCGWCMKLQNDVFSKPEFIKWAKENVILVELDYPKRKQLSQELTKQNQELQQMFAIKGYPTVWFVSPSKTNGKISFEKLGSTGYDSSVDSWITNSDLIIKNKK